MLPSRTMASSKPSKQASAAASKIKTKMLNTSSFFKVSLKTNNKALALALEAQKERSRQLEKEIVYLQKQVETLCFELSTKKYKQRKLLLILKNLHSNTLNHLDMVVDLFSDSDLPKLSEDYKTFSEDNNDNLPIDSLPDELPTETSKAASRLPQRITEDLLEKNLSVIISGIQTGPKKSPYVCNGNPDDERRHSDQHIPALQTGTLRRSSSLRNEVERLSMIFSQSGYDIKSVPCIQNSQAPSVVSTSEAFKPTLIDNDNLPGGSVMETEPEHRTRQDKTVLLNTTMEMTLSNANEIVTVETKAKKTGRSGKLKSKKNKEHANRSVVAENPQVRDTADANTISLVQTDYCIQDSLKEPDISEYQLPKKDCKGSITSRISKLSESEAGNHQKIPSNSKSKTESCGIVSPVYDDYFMDPEIEFSKAKESVKFPPEKDDAEKAASKITCRRSKTKGRRMTLVARKTFVTLPCPSDESESSQSKLELVHDKVEKVEMKRFEESKKQEAPKESLLCADKVPCSELLGDLSSSSSKKPHKIVTATNSGEGQKARCRATFLISVNRDSTSLNSESPDVLAVDPGASWDLEMQSEVMAASAGSQQLADDPHKCRNGEFVETESSLKFPWVAAEGSESLQEDFSSNGHHGEQHVEGVSTTGAEFKKPKKTRREEACRFSEKKAVCREECVDHSTESVARSFSGSKRSKIVTATNSEGQKSRCRGTFLISVNRDSTTLNCDSLDMLALDPGTHHEVEEPSAVMAASIGQQQSAADPHKYKDGDFVETERSYKCPLVATQDSESLQEDFGSCDHNNEQHLEDVSSTVAELKKPKKARREEACRSSKKKAGRREEHASHSNESLACSSIVSKPQSKIFTAPNSGDDQKSRCRGTFVISVTRDSTTLNCDSPDMLAVDPGTHCEVEEPSEVIKSSVARQNSSDPHNCRDGGFGKEMQSSYKRPWMATQEPGSLKEDLMSSNYYNEVMPLEEVSTSDTEFQKPKKARREEMGRSNKKKTVQKDHSKDKKRSKCSRVSKGFKPEDDVIRFPQESSGALTLNDSACTRDSDGNEQQLDDLHGTDLQCYISKKDEIFGRLSNSNPTKSKSKFDWDPKWNQKTSRLPVRAETRNPAQSFVVNRQQNEDSAIVNMKSNVLGANDCKVNSNEAAHQNLADLLADEMPPWLTSDGLSGLCSPQKETLGGTGMMGETATVTTDASPAARVLVSLTNTISTPDKENRGRTRRGNGVISYKEPSLISKIRRGDKFTDSMFLSSPVFKDGKKKQKKTKSQKAHSVD